MKNWIFLNLLFIATACTVQKRVCPAYQSAFIFDKNTRENHFSYYNNHFKETMTVTASSGKSIEIPPKDTLWMLRSVGLDGPAIPFQKKVKRNKYLLLPKKSYRKALKLMRTVERKFVYEAYDSAKMEKTHRLDSISLLDSAYRISEAREKFNLDQDAYMWYFKDQLLLPDARWEKFDKLVEEEKLAKETAKKNRKGLFSFLRRKKKITKDTAIKVLPENFTIEQKTKVIEEEDYNADEQYDVDDELADSTAVGKPDDKKKGEKVKAGKTLKPKNASADQSKWSRKERRKKEKEEAEKKAAKEKAARKKADEKAAEIDESLLREKETKTEPVEKEETAPADKPQDTVEEGPSKNKK